MTGAKLRSGLDEGRGARRTGVEERSSADNGVERGGGSRGTVGRRVGVRGNDGNRFALNRFVVQQLGGILRVDGRMTVDGRARFWRPGREPPRAVVHPDLESVFSRGKDVQVAVAIDISRKDVLCVDVIAERYLAREAIRVGGASRD